jgi:hypothetical protein
MHDHPTIRSLMFAAIAVGILFAGVPDAATSATFARGDRSSCTETAVKSAAIPVGCAALKTAQTETVPVAQESSREQYKQGRCLVLSSRDSAIRPFRNDSERLTEPVSEDATPVAQQVRLQI